MTVEWRDICPRCEAVLSMPDDGSGHDHVCEDRKDFLSVLHWRHNERKQDFIARFWARPPSRIAALLRELQEAHDRLNA
jgi:hypothetical protein